MNMSAEQLNFHWAENFDLDFTLQSLQKNGYTFHSWLDLAEIEELEEFVNTLIDAEKYELIPDVKKKIEEMKK